ncbi:chemotaxis protein CheC [Pontibacter ummariensis]|uniref:Chemotaxis protein CheC n=1 Tax=Pontibacter ummariensis TaxID=1610492 RepID=A0A239CA53_9BACT|nr:chemotaxis protein CheC [Pontibacter ummariensis]PRY15395.1 chemotaxis protein CheC [Pontibacter ummariensis]SNS16334.1 chemotaxis protein CheC [Pontibacter ummariensis]
MMTEPHITELERDIIKEILNIGLARAADSFAAIAKDKVLLKVPDIQLIEVKELLGLVAKYEDTHVIIQSDIKGDFNGATLMLFSDDHIIRLSEVCLAMLDVQKGELSVMQESLLLEISNIITGALVTQLANILKCSIYGSPPKAPQSHMADSLKDILVQHPLFQPLVFTVITQFTHNSRSVELPLLLFFDSKTFLKILDIIRAFELGKNNLTETD